MSSKCISSDNSHNTHAPRANSNRHRQPPFSAAAMLSFHSRVHNISHACARRRSPGFSGLGEQGRRVEGKAPFSRAKGKGESEKRIACVGCKGTEPFSFRSLTLPHVCASSLSFFLSRSYPCWFLRAETQSIGKHIFPFSFHPLTQFTCFFPVYVGLYFGLLLLLYGTARTGPSFGGLALLCCARTDDLLSFFRWPFVRTASRYLTLNRSRCWLALRVYAFVYKPHTHAHTHTLIRRTPAQTQMLSHR